MLILKLFFYFFYINNYFSNKDKTPYFLKSFLIYKFACARCNSCYIGETCRHFKTRNDEHVKKDKKFQVTLFQITLQHSFKLRLKKVSILIGRSQTSQQATEALSYYSFYLVTLPRPFYFPFLFIKANKSVYIANHTYRFC